MSHEDRKKLAERLRDGATVAEDEGNFDCAKDFRAAADLIDPPAPPAGTQRMTAQSFRRPNGSWTLIGFSSDTPLEVDERIQFYRASGHLYLGTVVADVSIPPDPPVVQATVQP